MCGQETGVADAHEAIPDHEDAHVLLAEELVEEFAESRAHFLFEVFQKNFLNFLRTFFEKWEKKKKSVCAREVWRCLMMEGCAAASDIS